MQTKNGSNLENAQLKEEISKHPPEDNYNEEIPLEDKTYSMNDFVIADTERIVKPEPLELRRRSESPLSKSETTSLFQVKGSENEVIDRGENVHSERGLSGLELSAPLMNEKEWMCKAQSFFMVEATWKDIFENFLSLMTAERFIEKRFYEMDLVQRRAEKKHGSVAFCRTIYVVLDSKNERFIIIFVEWRIGEQ